MASGLIPEYFIGEGTLINALLVFVGGYIGDYLKEHIPSSLKESIIKAFGLFSFGMAYHLFNEGSKANIVEVLACLIIGGVVGYYFDFETNLDKVFSSIFKNIGSPEGFNTATIMFCVGPITILGCIMEGARYQNSLILSKALMDGISAVLLASSMGRSVAFASFSILLYQGSLTYISYFFKSSISVSSLENVSFIGACLIVGLALKLLGINKDLKLLNFILSPIIAIFIKS
ncbi:MAG: DUF554 domain-containing protein [Hydrogenobaculum sp.]